MELQPGAQVEWMWGDAGIVPAGVPILGGVARFAARSNPLRWKGGHPQATLGLLLAETDRPGCVLLRCQGAVPGQNQQEFESAQIAAEWLQTQIGQVAGGNVAAHGGANVAADTLGRELSAGTAADAQRQAARAHPVYVCPSDRHRCMHCSKAFGMFDWKHHCRYCGWVICAECSENRLVIDRWVPIHSRQSTTNVEELRSPPTPKEKRVCNHCYAAAPHEIRLRQERTALRVAQAAATRRRNEEDTVRAQLEAQQAERAAVAARLRLETAEREQQRIAAQRQADAMLAEQAQRKARAAEQKKIAIEKAKVKQLEVETAIALEDEKKKEEQATRLNLQVAARARQIAKHAEKTAVEEAEVAALREKEMEAQVATAKSLRARAAMKTGIVSDASDYGVVILFMGATWEFEQASGWTKFPDAQQRELLANYTRTPEPTVAFDMTADYDLLTGLVPSRLVEVPTVDADRRNPRGGRRFQRGGQITIDIVNTLTIPLGLFSFLPEEPDPALYGGSVYRRESMQEQRLRKAKELHATSRAWSCKICGKERIQSTSSRCPRCTAVKGRVARVRAPTAAATPFCQSDPLGSTNRLTHLSGGSVHVSGSFHGYKVAGASMPQLNGFYRPLDIPSYIGVQPYANARSDRYNIIRWQGTHWLLVDMGIQRNKFPGNGGTEYYRVRCSDPTPLEGMWPAVSESAPAPLADQVFAEIQRQNEELKRYMGLSQAGTAYASKSGSHSTRPKSRRGDELVQEATVEPGATYKLSTFTDTKWRLATAGHTSHDFVASHRFRSLRIERKADSCMYLVDFESMTMTCRDDRRNPTVNIRGKDEDTKVYKTLIPLEDQRRQAADLRKKNEAAREIAKDEADAEAARTAEAEAEAARAEEIAKREDAKRRETEARAKAERDKRETAEAALKAAEDARVATQQRLAKERADAAEGVAATEAAQVAAKAAAERDEQYRLEAAAQHNLSWEHSLQGEWAQFSVEDSRSLSARYQELSLGLDPHEPEPEAESATEASTKLRLLHGVVDLVAFTLMSEAPIGWPKEVIFSGRQAKINIDLRSHDVLDSGESYNYCTLDYLDDGTQSEIVPCEEILCLVEIRGFKDKVIPLRPIETAEHLQASKLDCVICFDSFAPADGISCYADAGKHFLCNTCFEEHVKTESETEAMDLLEQREGCVFCPMRQYGCEETPAFSDAEVARHCNDAVFVIYTDAKKKLVEARLAEQIGAEERDRMDAELERLRKMTDEEREVEKERRHIEDMLNLKCPRCKMVFVDFTNCAALTCGKAGCGCGFCAWCQEDCGDDAHQHVANCPVKPRGADTYYDTKDEFMLVQRRRQRAAITAYLRDDVKRDIQPRVAEACRVVLTGAEMGDICDLYPTRRAPARTAQRAGLPRGQLRQPRAARVAQRLDARRAAGVAARDRVDPDPDEDDFMLAMRLQMQEDAVFGRGAALPWAAAGNARPAQPARGGARRPAPAAVEPFEGIFAPRGARPGGAAVPARDPLFAHPARGAPGGAAGWE
jgi:hypothetical protein